MCVVCPLCVDITGFYSSWPSKAADVRKRSLEALGTVVPLIRIKTVWEFDVTEMITTHLDKSVFRTGLLAFMSIREELDLQCHCRRLVLHGLNGSLSFLVTKPVFSLLS